MPNPASQQDEGHTINTASWRIVTILVILSAVAAGLLFATGLKANADSAPSYDDRSTCGRAFADQSGCDIQGR
jgi:hypothetical protein